MLALLIISSAIPQPIHAKEAPYSTYTVDKDGFWIATLDGYLPLGTVDVFGGESLSSPSDIFISERGNIYMADTGNKRVLACTKDFVPFLIINEGLQAPAGIYVDNEDRIYVADPRAKKIILYSADGDIIKEYEQPVSPLFGEGSKYAPSKLVVNDAGSIFAVSDGNVNGIMNISKEGDFYGYFGANETSLSMSALLKRIFFTEEQKKNLQKNVPPSAINLDIDSNGLIYTATQGNPYTGLKKLNMAGKNMLSSDYYKDPVIMDVAAGPIDNIFSVSKDGYIYEYTRDGEILFCFGGTDDGKNRVGLFMKAVAIETDDSGLLYVLDGEKNEITIFEPTEYAVAIHEALYLYQEGFYVNSEEPWNRALSMNGLLDYAYRGISKANYRLNNYEEAMKTAKLGGDYRGYSEAFWQIRNNWLRKYIILMFFILLGFFILRKIWKNKGDRIPVIREVKRGIRKIGSFRLLKELKFLTYMVRNPADAFYGIKREGKVSVISASILYLMIFVIFILNKYFCGYIFKTVMEDYYEFQFDLGLVFGVLGLVVICNNLICSIKDGEGTLKNVYCSLAYCFMPYIFLKPLVVILSHVLTFNESFILLLLNFVIYVGTAIFIFIMVKEIQDYTIKKTVSSILLTAFTMVVAAAAGVIIFVLTRQVVDFIVSIYREGYYRGF